MRSPIERMVDEATGYDVANVPVLVRPIELQCPKCKVSKTIVRQGDEPERAVKVLIPCPACWPKGAETAKMIFLDQAGVEVFAHPPLFWDI